MIPLWERHFRRTIAQYVEHYHRERNHQGIANELIAGASANQTVGRIRRPSTPGWVAQLLRSRGVIVGSAEQWDITPSVNVPKGRAFPR
jgi:hypothetical protein